MSLADQIEIVRALHGGRLNAEQEKQIENHFTAHPEDRAVWEEELGLNQLLRQLGDAPISSNFTARVLQAVRQEASQPWPSSKGRFRNLFSGWIPKLATAAAVMALGLFSYQQHRVAARQELAQHLAEMAKLGPLELLENFDAINQVPRDRTGS